MPKANLVGQKNQGWMVAMTNMMFERTIHGGRTDMMVEVRQLGELAKKVQRNGHPAWDDNYVRQRIARFACEAEALKYTSYRQLTRQLKGLPPGPEGSIMKLGTTDLNLRIQTFAMELLGPYSQFEYQAAGRDRSWQMVASDARGAARHYRGRHQRDSAQHHRRARARPAQGLKAARSTICLPSVDLPGGGG